MMLGITVEKREGKEGRGLIGFKLMFIVRSL